MGMRSRHYAAQGGPHNDYQSYGDTMVLLKPKVVIHINGFYLPCPTVKQIKLTKDLIDNVGQKSAPGFSVNMISAGNSVNQHCGFAGGDRKGEFAVYCVVRKTPARGRPQLRKKSKSLGKGS